MSLNKVNNDGSLLMVAGGILYADSPIGTILPYGGATAPSGWFLCQGQAISRTTYAELFAVIGTAFGAGDGSTTFNLPDMREAVPKGAGLTGHTVGAHLDADGLAVGEFLDDRLQSHQHSVTLAGATSHIGNSVSDGSYHNYKSGGATASTEIRANNIEVGRSGDTTEVKSVGVNYIIKAKMIAVPADFMSVVSAYRLPDWSRGVNIPIETLDAGYSAPEDGLLVGFFYGSTMNDYYLKIEDIVVAKAWYNSDYSFGNVQCPIGKGDVAILTPTPSNVGINFIPFKL